MKNIIRILLGSLVCIAALAISEANAQACPNPAGCIYVQVTLTINYQTSRVLGHSDTQAD